MTKGSYYIVKQDRERLFTNLYRKTSRVKLDGYRFVFDGLSFGVSKVNGAWGITHLKSGYFVASTKTKKDVIPYLEKHHDIIDKIKTMNNNIDREYLYKMAIEVCQTGRAIYEVWRGYYEKGYFGGSFERINDIDNGYGFINDLFEKEV